MSKNHDNQNADCPLNDPETMMNPATRGLSCTCPEPKKQTDQKFKVRYMVEPWGKPKEGTFRRVHPNIQVSEDKYGYTDILFVGSIILDEKGKISSILLMDSETGSQVSREVLEAILYQVDHQLRKHAPPSKGPMTTYEHARRHEFLHVHLDELIADFLNHNRKASLSSSIEDLMRWSNGQCSNPTEVKE